MNKDNPKCCIGFAVEPVVAVTQLESTWPGFDEQAGRDNIEWVWDRNFIDPMRVNVPCLKDRPAQHKGAPSLVTLSVIFSPSEARWHDVYPKPDLDGNFLGDGYPLCSDLPPAYFLSQGSKSYQIFLWERI